MSDTPITDKSVEWGVGGLEVVPSRISRQIERKLNQVNKHKEWLILILGKVTDYEPARQKDLSRAYEVMRKIAEEDKKYEQA